MADTRIPETRKPQQQDTVRKPVDRNPETATLDTLQKKGEEQPGRGNSQPSRRLLPSYKVFLMLPFLTDRFNEESGSLQATSRWSVNFLGGVKMALDVLESEQVNLELTVLDTRAAENGVDQVLRENPDLESAHLIIGPYRRNNIQKIAQFAREKQIIQVSPYSAASNLTKNNPYFIQVRPSLETHAEALVRHALDRYSPERITLVGQPKESEQGRMQVFQRAYQKWAGSGNVAPLNQLVANSSGYSLSQALRGDTAVFIVSAWAEDDERFVYSFLRNLDLARRAGQHVVVYGTPVWENFERVELDYFEKANLHISSHLFLDPNDPDIVDFRRDYFNRFGALPTEEAYLGYDVMRYFGRMLHQNGAGFQPFLEGAEQNMLHTRFEFERVAPPGSSSELNPAIDQYQNTFVPILRFKEYKFQLANFD